MLGTARVQCYDPDRVRPPEESSLHTEAAGSAPPDAFGPFRVLHQIGAGALGPVFRAYDPEQDKLVAVKLFRLDLPPERVHEFVGSLERLIAADLTHCAIAAPLATGIVEASAFLAQDFVAADSLDTVVREHGPAPAGEALRIITQLAGALDFAAVVGIVHGALHPRDVLICPDDVRVTGLGVARALESAGAQAPVRRPYAAPERAAGTALDRRADVFSLATLAHELLWGRRVAAIGAAGASGLADLPGARMDALRLVFSKGLAEDPADRFATALDFAEALKDSFSQESVRESGVGSRESIVTGRESVVKRPESGAVRLSTDSRLPTSDSGLSTSDSQLPTTDSRLSTTDSRLSTTDSRLPTTDSRLPTTDSGLSTPDSRLPARLPLDLDDLRAEPDDALPPGRVEMKAPTPPAPAVQEAKPPALVPVGRMDERIEPREAEGRVDDLVLRRAEEARFHDVEMAPAVVDETAPIGAVDADDEREEVSPARAAASPVPVASAHSASPAAPISLPHPASISHPGHVEQRLDASRSAVWPLSLALIVGLALGFAGGYGLGQSGRQEPAAVTPSANAATAGTETDAAIKPDPVPPRPAEVPPMSAAPPAAVPSAVEPSAARTAPSAEAAKPKPEPPVVARTGRITVRTAPAGARVLIDGKDVGKTPLTVPNLARGTHTVRVMRDGYTSLDRRVSITTGEPTATLTLNLTRTPPPAARAASPAPAAQASAAREQTSLLVESRPTGATVILDGKRVGTTPMSLPSVTIGNHAVRLELAGFRPWTASVRVVSGERNRVAASLEEQ